MIKTACPMTILRAGPYLWHAPSRCVAQYVRQLHDTNSTGRIKTLMSYGHTLDPGPYIDDNCTRPFNAQYMILSTTSSYLEHYPYPLPLILMFLNFKAFFKCDKPSYYIFSEHLNFLISDSLCTLNGVEK